LLRLSFRPYILDNIEKIDKSISDKISTFVLGYFLSENIKKVKFETDGTFDSG